MPDHKKRLSAIFRRDSSDTRSLHSDSTTYSKSSQSTAPAPAPAPAPPKLRRKPPPSIGSSSSSSPLPGQYSSSSSNHDYASWNKSQLGLDSLVGEIKGFFFDHSQSSSDLQYPPAEYAPGYDRRYDPATSNEYINYNDNTPTDTLESVMLPQSPILTVSMADTFALPTLPRWNTDSASPQPSISSPGSQDQFSSPWNQQDMPLLEKQRQTSRRTPSRQPAYLLLRVQSVVSAPSIRPQQPRHQRQSSSVSLIWSSGSYRNVSLALLRRSLSLKPGEGERSLYVSLTRRSAGTANNETGPGSWRLPSGIMPMDKSSSSYSNDRYIRLAGTLASNNRRGKKSGVELKHGHLAPRLLAAEVGEGEASIIGERKEKAINDEPRLELTPAELGNTIIMELEVPPPVIEDAFLSRTGSISSVLSATPDILGFYQHPVYRTDTADDLTLCPPDESRLHLPRLVLANPDGE